MVEPLVATETGAPDTATRTFAGFTAKLTVTRPPRCTTIGRPDAAIGAPQWAPQHHDETASRTWPGAANAAGGLTAPSSNTTSATIPQS
jgi:hypothetical protein